MFWRKIFKIYEYENRLAISISTWSVFFSPKYSFISPYPSNYFYYLTLQIQLHVFNTIIFDYVRM